MDELAGFEGLAVCFDVHFKPPCSKMHPAGLMQTKDLCCCSEKVRRSFCSSLRADYENLGLFFWLFFLGVMSLLSHSCQIDPPTFFYSSSTFSCPLQKRSACGAMHECFFFFDRPLLCYSQPSPHSLRPVFNPAEAAAATLKHPCTRPLTSARHYSKLQE